MTVDGRVFAVNYESADLELMPQDALWPGMPSTSIRITMSNYKPLSLMSSSAVLYWFVLVPHVFPALRPTSASGK